MAESQEPELTIESITTGDTAIEPESLDDAQREFLTSKAEELDDETAEKYGIEKPVKIVVPEAKKPDDSSIPPAKKDKEGDDDVLEIDEDEVRIQKVVADQLKPFQQKTIEQANVIEVDEFIRSQEADIPKIAQYRGAILETMKKDGFQRLTAAQVFNIVAGNDLMRMGAARERNAAKKAKETITDSSGGSRPKSESGKKDWSAATKEELHAEQARILGRQGS